MNELFKVVYDRLVAQLTGVDVYDHVPEDLPSSNYPFVRIDPLELDENDTDTENGFEATLKIVSFSRYRGSKEVADLQQTIYNALHRWQIPDTASYGISGIDQSNAMIVTNPDGLTRHSVQTFKILFEPLP